MPHRDSSPAMSENEFDITNSLFQNDSESDNDEKPRRRQKPKPAPTGDLDFLGADDGR